MTDLTLDLGLLQIVDAAVVGYNGARATPRLTTIQSAMSNVIHRLCNTPDDEMLIRTAFGVKPAPKAYGRPCVRHWLHSNGRSYCPTLTLISCGMSVMPAARRMADCASICRQSCLTIRLRECAWYGSFYHRSCGCGCRCSCRTRCAGCPLVRSSQLCRPRRVQGIGSLVVFFTSSITA